MKPAAFDYVRAGSLDHALAVLAQAGPDAKVLAGGQSLLPMLNFRLVKPTVLIDINHVPELGGLDETPERLRLGALTRHRITGSDPRIGRHFPVLHEAMGHVAHFTVRNRGTLGGSLSHADPATELPMMALLLEAELHISSARGVRTVLADDFLVSAMSTVLEPDEIVTAIDLPLASAAPEGWAFEEYARRHGDYALAATGITFRFDGTRASNVRIAAMGIGDRAIRVPAAETVLEGTGLDESAVGAAVAALRESISPHGDLNGSAEYRRHLAGVLLKRAIGRARNRALRHEDTAHA